MFRSLCPPKGDKDRSVDDQRNSRVLPLPFHTQVVAGGHWTLLRCGDGKVGSTGTAANDFIKNQGLLVVESRIDDH